MFHPDNFKLRIGASFLRVRLINHWNNYQGTWSPYILKPSNEDGAVKIISLEDVF